MDILPLGFLFSLFFQWRQLISQNVICQKFDSTSIRSSPLPTNGTSEIKPKLQKSRKLTAKFPVAISKKLGNSFFSFTTPFSPLLLPKSGPHSSERLIQAALLFPWQHCHGNCRVHSLLPLLTILSSQFQQSLPP